MTSSSSPRETIQISFGPTSNAITSHLINLQGLACTTSTTPTGISSSNNSDGAYTQTSPSSPYCDPHITHSIERSNNNNNYGTWVPRVLFIDEAVHSIPDNINDSMMMMVFNNNSNNNDGRTSSSSSSSSMMYPTITNTNMNMNTNTTTMDPSILGIPWNGGIQNWVGIGQQQQQQEKEGRSGQDSNNSYFNIASTLAYSPYSRYNYYNQDQQEQQNTGRWRSDQANYHYYHDSRIRQPHHDISTTSSYGLNSNVDNSGNNNKNNNIGTNDDVQQRHVVWDDMGEEHEEEEEEDEEEQKERLARMKEKQRLEWYTETAIPLSHDLDRLTEQRLLVLSSSSSSSSSIPASETITTTRTSNNHVSMTSEDIFRQQLQQQQQQQKKAPPSIHWTDIWMPPRNEKSKLILPYSSQSQLVPHWDVIYGNVGGGSNNGTDPPFLNEWKHDVLVESIRHILEGCDYGIQGATLTTEGNGIYAHLTSFLLDELHDECKSAIRMVHHIRTNNNTRHRPTTSSSLPGTDDNDDEGDATSSWQQDQVRRVRDNISSGLALYDFTHKAHCVLPLRLNDDVDGNCNDNERCVPPIQVGSVEWFKATAQIAMALEGCTLPYRFQSNSTNGGNNINYRPPNYQMGLQNAPFMARHGTIDETTWGGTTPALTMAEYLSMVQPTNSNCMLELDTLLDSNVSNNDFFHAIQEGTTVQRDVRMQEHGEHAYRSRPQQVLPGGWLQDRRVSMGNGGGLLSSLSYSTMDQGITPSHGSRNGGSNGTLDRSIHHHFSLSTSVRPLPIQQSNSGNTLSNYVTCLVEGMGVRYRPERSMGIVLNQTIGQLTFGSNDDGGVSSVAYGAGVYWKRILPSVDTPVVAVLGNTTRAYYSLDRISNNMKSAMRDHRFRGYYNRDVMNGVLPELDDCDEALEGCLEKRDIYQPPHGAPGQDLDD